MHASQNFINTFCWYHSVPDFEKTLKHVQLKEMLRLMGRITIPSILKFTLGWNFKLGYYREAEYCCLFTLFYFFLDSKKLKWRLKCVGGEGKEQIKGVGNLRETSC